MLDAVRTPSGLWTGRYYNEG
ncbi:MAG: hypothetical protein K0R67_2628, partial [Paenibacillus sp.]|nr:hypothetical protein [Paenibacillus sp.]